VQIALRNFFHGGLLWADPLMRHIVLWIGCLGAALATSSARHINIDVFSRMLPAGARRLQRTAIYAVTAFAAFLLGVSTWRLVVDERSFGDAAWGSVQVWVLQLVLPVAFFLISYRSLVNLFTGFEPEEESIGMEGTEGSDGAEGTGEAPEPAKP
jgi:TRAP-type C4-dicarboxylate transport system permease small subunit